jgi:hypothetical protein
MWWCAFGLLSEGRWWPALDSRHPGQLLVARAADKLGAIVVEDLIGAFHLRRG